MKKSWNEKERYLINWFLSNQHKLPQPPFQLDVCRRVTGLRFYDALKADIEKGPSGPRAMYNALQKDLLLVYKLYVNNLKSQEDEG